MNKIFLLSFWLLLSAVGWSQQKAHEETTTWTYTYLKALPERSADLKAFLEKNWFVMDSIAVQQGLFKSYELIENVSDDSTRKWDYIVAVEYFSRDTYDAIAERFEAIRKAHVPVLVNNLGFKDLGRIVDSQTVVKKNYLR